MATNDPRGYRPVDDSWAWGWWWIIWVFLIVIFFFGGWGFGGWWGYPWWGSRPAVQTVPQQVVVPENQGTPGEFMGKSMTLSGQVDHVLGNKAFTLLGAPNTGRDLLVVPASDKIKVPALKKGEELRVTGTVQKFERGSFHKETGLDYSPGSFGDYQNRPAIVASSITVVPAGNQTARGNG